MYRTNMDANRRIVLPTELVKQAGVEKDQLFNVVYDEAQDIIVLVPLALQQRSKVAKTEQA